MLLEASVQEDLVSVQDVQALAQVDLALVLVVPVEAPLVVVAQALAVALKVLQKALQALALPLAVPLVWAVHPLGEAPSKPLLAALMDAVAILQNQLQKRF